MSGDNTASTANCADSAQPNFLKGLFEHAIIAGSSFEQRFFFD
jgi:hypothetical protein